jgi:hypothetical protein
MHYVVTCWTNLGGRREDATSPTIGAAESEAERLEAEGYLPKQIDRVSIDGERVPVRSWPRPEELLTPPPAA